MRRISARNRTTIHHRLLSTDKKVLLPLRTDIRLEITASDVLHSWAVPAFGVKMDACPGRLNQASLNVHRLGTFYGQCSELCGINHSFMPIAVEVLPPSVFVRRAYGIGRSALRVIA